MRKIKFKGYSKNEQLFNIENCTHHSEGDDSYRFVDDNFVFVLFTGLLDVNGREIYEGDILEDGFSESLFIVDWQFNGWCKRRLGWDNDTIPFALIDRHDLASIEDGGMGYHVVGNIYAVEFAEVGNDD